MFDVSLPEINCDAVSDSYGRYRIEPLQPGWGTTLGASLRRILISSLQGAAVTGIRLTEMPDDPSEIPGVEEGLIDLVLNVKQLRFRVSPVEEGEEPRANRATLRVVSKLPGEITGASLELPEGLEVVNPDTLIATANGDGSTFELELLIETGIGYGSAEVRTDLPADVIPVDAVYTPVPRVNFVVEHTRVGQMTDYDRLLLEIWTDGTLPPDDALSQAARILTGYATAVARYGRDVSDLGIEEPAAPVEDDTNRPIEVLSLSMRTTNALKRANITSIAQVLAYSDNDLLHLRNFGQKSLVELQEALQAHGYFRPIEEGALGDGEEGDGEEDEE
ncbi:MAG TPA: DNA-directed RNA polymerase subunit alpha [Chloroflexia bacterium]|nr:DNA-directed RNA polymerase subunit alpha [Chloroflexia bacterium]